MLRSFLSRVLLGLTVACVVLQGQCVTRHRGASHLSATPLEPDFDYPQSVGFITKKEGVERIGVGFVVTKAGPGVVGVTSTAVWEQCLADSAGCIMNFAERGGRGARYPITTFRDNGQVVNWSGEVPSGLEGLAFFSIDAPQHETLVAVPLAFDIPVNKPLQGMAVGYTAEAGGDIWRTGGVFWLKPGGLGSTFAQVPLLKGSPVFGYMPARDSYRMEWRVVGMLPEKAGKEPLTAIEQVNLLEKKWPTLKIWAALDRESELKPIEAMPFPVKKAQIERQPTGRLRVELTVTKSDHDWNKLFLNSRQISDFEGFTVDHVGETAHLAFLLPHDMTAVYDDTPFLVLEYNVLSEHVTFTPCFAQSLPTSGLMPLNCGWR